ncbi:SCO2584 family spore wall biosynthesis protein [Streptomyces sp. CA2R101]|uniref:SCO2584 family spore wall biosynthesis protein n=1 Tax=Streptomyces sp. CA2R101 TaxID=3120152 RepID=UPI003009F25E
MPDDVGGKPFPDGEEPDEHHHGSHGKADEEFASVVFDEEFVRSAQIHEPSAVERMLAAAEARAEADAARSGPGFGPEGDDVDETGLRSRRRVRGSDDFDGYTDYAEYDDDSEFGDYPPYGPYGPYGGALRPYRSSTRWHRPVAWVLAVVMGIGLVALAFSAVYRGSSGRTQSPAPAPTSSGVDAPATGVLDSVRTARPGLPSAEPLRPSFPAAPKPH